MHTQRYVTRHDLPSDLKPKPYVPKRKIVRADSSLDNVWSPGISEDSPHVEGTTLLKPVPYKDMDKDERAEILRQIALMEQFEDPNDESYHRQLEFGKLVGFYPGNVGIQVGPVLQVISVSISHTSDPSWTEFEIYGVISVTDHNNKKTFPIYERKSNNPEAISPANEELSIYGRPIAPVIKGKVEFDLTNKNGVRFAAIGDVDWSFTDNCEDEEELAVYFNDGYYAMMIYTIIPFARIADVRMTLIGPPNSSKETIHVGGEITVCNVSFLKKNEFSRTMSDEYRSVYRVEQSRTVFAIPSYSLLAVDFSLDIDGTEFATGTIGSIPCEPRTSIVSLDCEDEKYYFCMIVDWIFPDEFFGLLPQVPKIDHQPPLAAVTSDHRSLVDDMPYIRLDDFFDVGEDDVNVKCSPNVLSQIDQPPAALTSDHSLVDDKNVKCRPEVLPQIDQPPVAGTSDHSLVDDKNVKCRPDLPQIDQPPVAGTSDHSLVDDKNVKCRPDLPQIDQPPVAGTSDHSLVDDKNVKCRPDLPPQIDQPPVAMTSSDHYVEVFSVFVGCRDSTLGALTGTIVVRDREETVYIFSRDTGRPDKLSSSTEKKFRTLSLAWPDDRWVLEEDFYMHLKLKDDKGNEVCRGSLRCSEYDGLLYLLRFDRRICAVIQGENDGLYFAAVHYSIFRNALRAKVTVTVDCEGFPCNFLDVYGSIYAEYSNHDYSSAYDKEYYRIIILDRPWEYRAKVRNTKGSEIRLSKSLVTAPSDCQGLIFSVDLVVRPFNLSNRAYAGHLSAIGDLQFRASKNDSIQLPLGGGRRTGCVTVKLDWFCCSHGSRVIEDSSSPPP